MSIQCLTELNGGFVLANPQPTEYTTCVHLLASPTDFSSQIFNISAAEGLQLSAAIVAVWAIAFATRMGIKATNVDESQ